MASANIDTDQIIPARFLLRPRDAGYADLLFRDLRFDARGGIRPDHVLNRPDCAQARILIAGENFGCGSAREQAVYALRDFGIRAVVAASFGEIFRLNCGRNGVIAAEVTLDEAACLRAHVERDPGAILTVDLPSRSIALGSLTTRFALDEASAARLASGRDEIDDTLGSFAELIARHEARSGTVSAKPRQATL